MSSPRCGLRLVSRLGLAGVLVATLSVGGAGAPIGPTSALAATASVFEGHVVELLQPSDVVGNGATPIDLHVLAVDAAGRPLVLSKSKLDVTGGTATELVDAGGGLYTFTFTPGRVEAATNASINLKSKLPNKDTLTRSWTVRVAPSRTHAIAATANPAALTLGTDKTANVAFAVTGGDPAALARVQLAYSASVGTITNVTHLGGGQFNGLYTAPTGNVPQVALVTAVDLADPTRGYASVAITLGAKFDQAVTVLPRAQVILKVGGREFGPVTADSKGRAKVPVVVPPGITTATRVQVDAAGAVSEESIALSVPEARRIALFPTATALPADGQLPVPVRALVVTPEGRPDESAQVEFTGSVGAFSAARHEGGGVYVATYTPPLGNAPVKATLSAKLVDRAPIQTDSRVVGLVPTRARRLSLAAEPVVLPTDATSLVLVAKVAGPDGAGLAGRTLAFSANGAKLAEVKDLKNGDYRATFTTTGKGPVEVSATVATAATANPLAHVLVLPTRVRLPPDGLSSTALTIATVDELGYPVADVDVDLRVLTGDGALPATTRTNASGIAQVYYTAGRKNGLVAIEAVAGDRAAGVSLLQAPPEVALPDLPVVVTPATRAMLDALGGTMAELRVERGG